MNEDSEANEIDNIEHTGLDEWEIYYNEKHKYIELFGKVSNKFHIYKDENGFYHISYPLNDWKDEHFDSEDELYAYFGEFILEEYMDKLD